MTLPTSFSPRLRRSLELIRPGSGSSRALPLDLLEDTTRRVRGWCWTVYGLAVVAILGYELGDVPVSRTARYAALAVTLITTVALHAAAVRDRFLRSRLLDLALVHEVAFAAAAAAWTVPLTWCAGDRSALLVTPVVAFVVLYPLLAPNTPARIAVASVLAAGMEPAFALLYGHAGVAPLPTAGQFLEFGQPNLVAAVLAVAVARVVHRWNRSVAHARELGSYHLEKKIAVGGMGEVWSAKHDFLARPAAVKFIKPDALATADQERLERLVARFEREAQSMAALRSPHAVRLYDFGMAEDGALFFAMELLDGIDLRVLVERHGPQPPGRVVRWLRQACHALHEAHEAGLVHRDIKPGNLMTCRHGLEVDHLKVLDFGLAKSIALASEIDRGRAGTPWYMAPEALLGLEALDRRADLYSLACVGYWLLSGQEVFGEPTPSKEFLAQLDDMPVPPSVKAGRPIPKPLEALLLQCLEKQPLDRPENARVLSDRLGELGLEERWTVEDATAWWARHGP